MNGRRAVFVDRDGTICLDKHYLDSPDGLVLIPTVAEGIRKLNEAGIPVVVVTNQSGVGRGFFSKKTLDGIHRRLVEMLFDQGARIEDIFYCPHLPGSGCQCRKPLPGMLISAGEKRGLDLQKSFVIGDRMMDIEMAHRVGALGILVPEPGDQYDVNREVLQSSDKPDFTARSFMEAVEWILKKMAVHG